MTAALLVLALALLSAPELDRKMVGCERAWIRGDVDALRACVDELEDSDDPRDVRYALAYLHWRLAGFHDRESDPFEESLKSAEELLKDLLEDAPDHADAHALYGTVNGGLITGMWSGMRRGPRADDAYQRALELAPDDPRVLMHQGVSRLFRPGMFGGGVDRAEEELSRALALFEEEPRKEPWPKWGHAEIHGWLGVVDVRKEDYAAARDHYERALELEPDFHWVRERLLPELETAETSRKR